MNPDSVASKPIAIYVLLDESECPRYVGKTNNPLNRLRAHKKPRTWVCGLRVLEWVSNDDRWQDRERHWVQYYGRFASLENITKGGGGHGSWSDETRAKILSKLKGRKMSGQELEKHRAASRLPSRRRKISQSKKGVPMSQSARQKLTEYWATHSRKGCYRASPETIAKQRAIALKNRNIYLGNTWGRKNKGRINGPHSEQWKANISRGHSKWRWLIYRDGVLLGDFGSSREAAKSLNMPWSTLRSIRNRGGTKRACANSGLKIVVVERKAAA